MKFFGPFNGVGFKSSIYTLRFLKDITDTLFDTLSNIITNDLNTIFISGGNYTTDGTNTNISNGILLHNKKIYSFQGGIFLGLPTELKIILNENTANGYPDPTYINNPTPQKIYMNRLSTINPNGTIDLVNVNYIKNILFISDNLKNKNEITIFHGNIIDYFDLDTGLGLPNKEWKNYAICDGRNGTPDYRNRVPLGFNIDDIEYNEIDKIGPEQSLDIHDYELVDNGKKIKLGVNSSPIHKHRVLAVPYLGGKVPGSNFLLESSAGDGETITGPNSGHPTSEQSEENPIELRQPYIVALFVKKIN